MRYKINLKNDDIEVVYYDSNDNWFFTECYEDESYSEVVNLAEEVINGYRELKIA